MSDHSDPVVEEMRFDRLALFTGRPVYWTVPPVSVTARRHTKGVLELLRWCLDLPGVCLGLDPTSIGLIVRSIYAQRGKKAGLLVDQWLDRAGAADSDVVSLPDDPEVFGPHLLPLLRHVRQAKDTHAWVAGDEARWWLETTERALAICARLFRRGRESEALLLRLMARHGCTVFAPFDGPSLWDHLVELLDTLPPERQNSARRTLRYHGLNGAEDLTSPCPLYWSWRLLDFAVSRRDLIYAPMLALWNTWPANRRWAPPPAGEAVPPPLLSASEAARLLDDVLWKKLETFFSAVRMACGLGIAEPEFADLENRPPVFYCAAPANPPLRSEDYVEKHQHDLHPLSRTCLGSDDPVSREVAWGILEGDLVTLRRERVAQGVVRSWYLLLPAASRPTPPAELETDLAFVARSMTFLEFSIGHEAWDVHTDLQPLATRQALWGGTLDAVSEHLAEATGLLPLLGQLARQRIYEELARVRLSLRHLQTRVEKVNSDVRQVVLRFQGYVDSSEDYLRRRMTFAPFPSPWVLSLLDALVDAYPYHYLQQPLRALQNVTETLSGNVSNITNTLSMVLEEAERFHRERRARRTRLLSLMAGLLALLIALPQFIPGSALNAETYPLWLSECLPLATLETVTRVLVGVVVVGLALVLIYSACQWIYHRLPHPDRFVAQVQQFCHVAERARVWAAVLRTGLAHRLAALLRQQGVGEELPEELLQAMRDATPDRAVQELERMDAEATDLLVGLWGDLTEPRREKFPQRVAAWLRRIPYRPQLTSWLSLARHLRYRIYLFDLCPDLIPLPRALSIFRYKSTDFHERTMISDWDFQHSLMATGFESAEVNRLDEWLSAPANREQIQEMDVRDFAAALRARGVTADEAQRTPGRWFGSIA